MQAKELNNIHRMYYVAVVCPPEIDEKEIATLSASTMVVMEWMDNRSCYALDECGYFYKRDPEIILMRALFLMPSTSMLLLKDQQFQRQ